MALMFLSAPPLVPTHLIKASPEALQSAADFFEKNDFAVLKLTIFNQWLGRP